MTIITPVAARFGWGVAGKHGPELAQAAHQLIGDQFPKFYITQQTKGSHGLRACLWDIAKLVNNGQNLPTFTQEIGDCVSMGATNAVNYLSCADIYQRKARDQYRPSFQPYIYGISRHQIGGDRIPESEAGSIGIWAAQGVMKYGTLWADYEGVPAYSGTVARQWGGPNGPPDNFVTYATQFLIKTTAKVSSYTETRDALSNYYPVTVASNRGFKMTLVIDKGKAWGVPAGVWGHQMCFIGVDDDSARPGCYCMNSWGPDAFMQSPDGAPPGGFWVDADVVDQMVKADGGDSWAYSNLDGYPARDLNYMLI